MQSRSLRFFRLVELLVCGMFAFMGASLLAKRHASHGAGVGLLVFAAFALVCFELRFWGHRRVVARVWRGLEQIGRSDLDAPATVATRGSDEFIEELAANRSIAKMMARSATRFCVSGTWRGREVEIGTAIVAGRDGDQLISYACAKAEGGRGPFRAMTRGAMSSAARLGMTTHPVPTGDAAFDEKWVVDADERVAATVLDASMRANLLELQTRLSWFQVASIEATRFGLVVRFPGELSPGYAAHLRDLAFEAQDRLARAA